jgi:hypothetical protein
MSKKHDVPLTCHIQTNKQTYKCIVVFFSHDAFFSRGSYRQGFKKWWKKSYPFPGPPVEQVKVRFIANTNRTLESFLLHKKPPRKMLTKIET